MTSKRSTLLAGCLALALAAAGCGGDDDEGGGGAQEQQGGTQEQQGGAATKAAAVSMKDIQFNPKDVTVAKGGTVTWKNDESVGHDVSKQSGPGPKFDSGDPGGMQQGDTFEQRFDQAGTIEYVCRVHAPGMAGTITVK